MRISVDLPQPDGPTGAATSPSRSSNATFSSAACGSPARAAKRLALIAIPGGTRAPARDTSFERLDHDDLDQQHDRDEGRRIGEKQRDVEQLEGDIHLKADAVRAADQFDDEHDLPHQRQARTHRGGEVRRELRQEDVAQARRRGEEIDLSQLVILRIGRARLRACRRWGWAAC